MRTEANTALDRTPPPATERELFSGNIVMDSWIDSYGRREGT